MKRQLRFLGVIAALVTAALACTGCGEDVQAYVVGTEAEMLGFTIGSVRINIAPEPTDILDFEDEDYDLNSMAVEIAPLERKTDTVNARFRPNTSRGARVLWGIGTQDMGPFSWNDLRIPANFDDGDYVYFRVTSEDGVITNYYRYLMWVRSPVVELAEVYIGEYITHSDVNDQGNTITVVEVDNRMMAVLATPSPTLDAAKLASAGTLDIRTNQSINADIEVVPYDASATVRYGRTRTAAETPTFVTSKTFTLADQDIVYIEVTAENTVDKAYYKLLINVGRINTVKSLTFIGAADVKFIVSGKGTPQSSYGATVAGKFETADMPDEGFGVQIELDDEAGRYQYLVYPKSYTATPQFPSLTTPNPAKVVFDGSNRLVIRVISEKTTVKYYKIDVELLAAKFSKQPKSDFYYDYNSALKVGSVSNGDLVSWYVYAAKSFIDFSESQIQSGITARAKSTPAILNAQLDRNITGTYQWYEANSWYGGYGFDADGRILYYPPGEVDAVPEDGFTGGDANNANTYYVNGFDEKKNVSFHNGGNQFYRLPVEGRPIPGATGSITKSNIVGGYTPTIADKRPFIDGFTSETHYYWVIVTETDTGRKATSKRAAIVTERDPRKEHYIVNLNEDLHLGNPGTDNYEEAPARNANPFTFQRETYKIPVTIDTDLNDTAFMNQFTVATVQALFFLKDGTPWIQNWTQGDIGFEDYETTRVMYYNLTNNNGTLGLVGGGKEPGGGTVEKKPKYIIVKPAGEKPVDSMPPLDANGKPVPNNNAQGWFTAFIELVEVRFEGPAR